MKNIYIQIYTIFLVIFITGCLKDKSPFHPEPHECPTDAKFIMDSYNFQANLQTHPDTDSLWCLLTYSFSYHYDKLPGRGGFMIIEVKEYTYFREFLDFYDPLPPNITKKIDRCRWINNNMEGVDSLYIEINLEGVLGIDNQCSYSFTWNKYISIPIVKN